MPGAVQILNTEHDDIQRTTFLPIMDRNFVFAVVDYSSSTQITNSAPVTVPFETDLNLHPTEMFSWDGDELTITDFSGYYLFTVRLNVGTGSGGSNSTVLQLWLELFSNGVGSYVEVAGSRTFVMAPDSYYNSVSINLPIKIIDTDLPAKVRLRGQVVHPVGSQSVFVNDLGRLFQVISLQACNCAPTV